MSSGLDRVYWDACAWIAYIQQERPGKGSSVTEDRYAMCKGVLKAAEAGILEIATSAFTLAEVCKNPEIKTSPADDLARFFDKSYILLTNVDKNVGIRAQRLQLSGVSKLKPPDAVHLASAIVSRSEIVHTFDEGLLDLSEVFEGLDGKPLRIEKPGTADDTGTLFEKKS